MMGVQMRIIGAMSMNVPSSRSRMLMRNSITYLLSVMARNSAVAFAGSCMIAIK